MEMTYLIIGCIAGVIIGVIIAYFALKSSMVSRSSYDELNSLHIKSHSDLENSQQKIQELVQNANTEKELIQQQSDLMSDLKNELAKISAEYASLNTQFQEQKQAGLKQASQIESLLTEKQNIYAKNSELSAINESLQQSLESQKKEIMKIQEEAKLQFENLASKILEEKTEKFTLLNQNNLKTILEPFQEKINDLKNRVNEAYEKENKERFSLAEKVKELAELNQQISEDAKKLTRALKGESKTQGNWGEMILESILEKSGLTKGQEYFLEHELRDEDNKALFSEFSGKKMRPDAVVKYPDERNVIIDSKVSLTAFTELVDETDHDIYIIKLNQHLSSIKNHIQQLSQKAYDDYGKSLDFVMMFIPSEPAYIAAMQADQNLWNYAYDRRILLLNPSNLITSLKLIADLWKREYQNRNSMEIAERGAKLYDKFVGFIENLEKVGKNLDLAKNFYNDAYKQLSTGNDNLVIQTQKLKSLGIKNKKELPQSLIDNSNLIE
ncbi:MULTISPECIES: DNA recombination protein RmuC [Chryseobacterium]|uniref:DNA recombination protein RmuC n=1 Tax=Chryseobacterium camelliae TaxID=1265445 RepID=A0ABU0TNG5_9FLAO|nr:MULTISPECIES: DNA recombination protein RmuC [Chryseobacterium]MDT3407554.1 DNA recombination protein RmuC [Pseudacidovorax intermedius]MDQ1098593.1 DNA recombination protein RmuC [Chryseobacterium camelliae]MDQ1102517.1 DNA recombination protein RmuC [Chryseobacterium sp. SORGH_AS_1048]MDR6085951.1 DNA recombination protein RmuC [Chryseobacterium sp. SORGH_AS_0909]MDR6130317.1 DNA recombination protein RmuC [Chryseobacterium sp. SORGH_AS_1175]